LKTYKTAVLKKGALKAQLRFRKAMAHDIHFSRNSALYVSQEGQTCLMDPVTSMKCQLMTTSYFSIFQPSVLSLFHYSM
jgi:hypothetical protein